MINCEQAQNLFDAYLNDDLSPSMTSEVDAHRLHCTACQHHLSLLEACGNVVRLDTSEPRVSEDFSDRLMAILDADTRGGAWPQVRRGMKVAGGLLGVAAAVAFVVWSFAPPPGAPPDNRVRGRTSSPPQTTTAASLITDLPISLLMDMTEALNSSIELGQYEVNHLRDLLDANGPPTLPDYQDLNTSPVPSEPELDVIDTLPDLDDGGELM